MNKCLVYRNRRGNAMILNMPETICKDEELHLLGWVSLLLHQKESVVFFQTLRSLESNKGRIFCKSSEIAHVIGVVTLIKSNSYLSIVLGKLHKLELIGFRKKQIISEDAEGNQKSQLYYEITSTGVPISVIISNLQKTYHQKIREETARRAYWDEQRMEYDRAYSKEIEENHRQQWAEMEQEQKTLEAKRQAETSRVSFSFSNFNHELKNIH